MIGSLLRWKSRQSRPAGWIRLEAIVSGMDDPPGDLVALLQRIQELVFLNGFGGRLEGKLRRRGMREHEQQRERGEQRLEWGPDEP